MDRFLAWSVASHRARAHAQARPHPSAKRKQAIERMPPPTAALVAASARLTHIADVAEALVHNAIAAQAQQICLTVHFADWRVECTDDGTGLSLDLLHRLKHGVDHKAGPTNALLAAAAVAQVEIWTRPPGEEGARLLTLRSGRAGLHPAPRGVEPRVRTRVVVRDLFHNLPVRRKAFPSLGDKAGLRAQWEQLKHRLALVCIPLSSSQVKVELYQAIPPGRRTIWRSPASAGLLGRYRSLLMLSSPGIEPTWLDTSLHVHSATPSLRIEGLVARPPLPGKAPSLVYLNGELIDQHTLVAHWLAEQKQGPPSSHPHHPIQARSLPPHLKHGMLSQPLTAFLVSLAASALGTNPVIVVSISFDFDSLPEARGQARALQGSIGGEWYALLVDRHKASPAKRKRDTPIHHDTNDTQPTSRRSERTTVPPPPLPSVPDGAIAWRDPTTRAVHLVDARTGNQVPQTPSGGQGQTLRRRLGLGPTPSSSRHEPSRPAWLEETISSLRRSPTRSIAPLDLDSTAEDDRPIQDLACPDHDGKEGEVAAYTGNGARLGDLALSRASLASARVLGQFQRKCLLALLPCGGGHTLVAVDQHAADERVRVEQFFLDYLRDCRRSARLEGDEILPLPPRPSQEQEDIRGRVSPWTSTSTAGHQSLSPPLDLSAQLAPGQLDRVRDLCSVAPSDPGLSMVFRGMLAFWGFHLDTRTKLGLNVAPSLVAERLQRDASSRWSHRLGGEVVKAVLAQAEGSVGAGGTRVEGGWAWMVRMLSCPPGRGGAEDEEELGTFLRFLPRPVRRMMESKACRGAIMFNDPLDVPEASRLIAQLARTHFPFQCAHGRPSLVPLVRLVAPEGQGRPEEGIGVDWAALAQIA